MLSVFKIDTAGGVQSYYEKESGQEGYWQKEAKEATAWAGKGAASLGLEGPVEATQFQGLMEGRLPDGTQLPSGAGGSERRAGYDATFSAPKSVSVAALVGGDERIFPAHDAAVRAAFEHMEREVAKARIKSQGVISTEQTGNLAAAVFRHQTSRSLDPHLHSHSVIANVTRTADGQWRALSSEELYRFQKVGGAIYRAELAKQLRELGYQLRQTKTGFEIDGVSDVQVKAFSQRREEVLDALEASGHTGAKAAEIAARASRTEKVVLDEEGRTKLEQVWQAKAESVGLDVRHLVETARERGQLLTSEQLAQNDLERSQAARAGVDHALAHLGERQSVFSRRDIITHAATSSATAGVDLASIEREIERRLSANELIRAGDTRLTTQEALKTEIRTVHAMRQGQGTMEPVTSMERVEQLTNGMTAGQAEAVKLALTTRDQVIGVQGYAGVGKTMMLRQVIREAQAQGYEVTGLAPSAQAAQVLEVETGAVSKTLAKHLLTQAGPDDKRQMWVIDEAGMLSARQAEQLLSKARIQGARLIMVGDRQQLSAVEAGKPFAVLSDKGMATTSMTEIMRQQNQLLKATVEDFTRHKGSQAIEKLAPHINVIESRAARLNAVANSYLDRDSTERAKTLVIVETNKDCQELNHQIRAGLREEGTLHGPSLEGTQLVKASMTRAQAKQAHNYQSDMQIRFSRSYESMGIQKGEFMAVAGIDHRQGIVRLHGEDGRQFDWRPARHNKVEAFHQHRAELQAGDSIRFTRNHYDLSRLNGHQAEILAVDHEARTAQIRMDDGKEQVLHLDDRQEQTWTHAYSATVHASQGATCDKAIIAIDTEQRMASEQSTYVAISRARNEVEIHTDDRERLAELAERDAGQESAIEAIQRDGYHSGPSLEIEPD